MRACRPTSMTSRTATAMRAFFGVQIAADLKGKRVRIQRSKEMITRIQAEAN